MVHIWVVRSIIWIMKKSCKWGHVYCMQARSILMLANKETERRVMTPTGSEPSSPILLQSPHNNMYSPSTGLSMKRSLQRFLQKRKNRVQETSPYHHELINVKLSKSSRENKWKFGLVVGYLVARLYYLWWMKSLFPQHSWACKLIKCGYETHTISSLIMYGFLVCVCVYILFFWSSRFS